ncbi:MAG: immunity 70 family protein [Bacteroidales bacterium]|nr:immunity 70 family protein [Lachnoclostridium sp.]MCM1384615.1 immunity 70 family protein [Lachnoclostridium sp.]MCM1463846.1 immunity 70 family protein [Bacteroidales bacterium]
MAVGFKVDYYWHAVGHGDFLHSFFSNICYHLEGGRWGSKYPYLMNKLYQGCLAWEDVKFAREELRRVKAGLGKLEPAKVIWDIDDLSKRPPWGDNISERITDLSNYFVTSGGRDLITILFDVFDEAEVRKHAVEIVGF